ncbi:MAG: helix-turn-helix transcriptional regulator [Afipia sp.]|jgi:DNA-binding HxlR family transcriptional regulator|nr:helix-turn-helix transcriptional regulator [Afipia sp.]
MKRQDFGCAPGCSVEVTLDLIDGKWKGVILYHLQEGRLRFGELRKRLPRITQRMLTKQLRALEEDDLIIRKVYAEVPPRVDYELSETGQRLRPVIDALKVWGDDNRARLDAASQAKAAGAGKARSKTETTSRSSREPQPA